MDNRIRRLSIVSVQTSDNGGEEKMSETLLQLMKDMSSQIQKAQYIKCRD